MKKVEKHLFFPHTDVYLNDSEVLHIPNFSKIHLMTFNSNIKHFSNWRCVSGYHDKSFLSLQLEVVQVLKVNRKQNPPLFSFVGLECLKSKFSTFFTFQNFLDSWKVSLTAGTSAGVTTCERKMPSLLMLHLSYMIKCIGFFFRAIWLNRQQMCFSVVLNRVKICKSLWLRLDNPGSLSGKGDILLLYLQTV